MLLVFVLFSSSALYNKSIVGKDSKNISDAYANKSTQGDPDPSGPPKKDPKSNKPNKFTEIENSKSLTKSRAVYPHTPVKVYHDASVSKLDIYKDFKDVSIIYM